MSKRPDPSFLVGFDEVGSFVGLPAAAVRKLIFRHALPSMDVHPGGYRAVARSAVTEAGVIIGRAAAAAHLGFSLSEMEGLWRSMRQAGIIEIDRQFVSTRSEIDAWRSSPAGLDALERLAVSKAAADAQPTFPL